MTKEETIQLFEILTYNIKGFTYTEETLNAWSEVLSQYDATEVFDRLKELLAERIFQTTTPTVYYIVKGLTKVKDKIDYSKMVVYCQYCHRPFNDQIRCEEHMDRCSSVIYILNQYKRFGLKPIPDKKYLYNLSEEEFDEKYKKLLRIVQERTTDEMEKRRIEFIFNPPSQEIAKKFLIGA